MRSDCIVGFSDSAKLRFGECRQTLYAALVDEYRSAWLYPIELGT